MHVLIYGGNHKFSLQGSRCPEMRSVDLWSIAYHQMPAHHAPPGNKPSGRKQEKAQNVMSCHREPSQVNRSMFLPELNRSSLKDLVHQNEKSVGNFLNEVFLQK